MEALRLKYIFCLLILFALASCSVYKYVPEGAYLLDDVDVTVVEQKIENPGYYKSLSYQSPNSKWFRLFRIPLRIYSLSGANKHEAGRNRLLRNIGEAPVICDSMLSEATRADLRQSLVNSGFLDAKVLFETKYGRKPKASVKYTLFPGSEYIIETINKSISDGMIEVILRDNDANTLLHEGMRLDANLLDDERNRITTLLHRNGYYRFNKDYISFVADTVSGRNNVILNMYIDAYYSSENGEPQMHPQYTLSGVDYIFTENTDFSEDVIEKSDRLETEEGNIYYSYDLKLRPEVLENHSFLRKGLIYNTDSISRTYSSLSRLGPIKNINIRFDENPDSAYLNAKVYMSSLNKYSFRFEMEGTNTAGDLGAAASMSVTDRNIFNGAEQLTVKLRGAYEAITKLQGYSGDTYKEYGVEMNLDFPEFLVPFASPEFQRRSQATSQFSTKFNAQQRPEFNKFIFSAGWSYIWSSGWKKSHRVYLFDLNYLVVPWISGKFKEEYLDPISSKNSILKYNYENLLITKLGYTFYYTNASQNSLNPFQYSLRLNFESSGNVLYTASKLFNAKKNTDGQYEVMDIAFTQYLKHDMSYNANWKIDNSNNLVFHLEYGIAYPYNNSKSLPFEKRYFAGGANSVRGWAVRELGPGSFIGSDRAIDYIKQSGDIKLGASIEYRSKLFWKLNGAFFIDAGNIWTIKEYEEQPGGLFYVDKFYKQIAMSYGVGLRLDFRFLVLRFDGGMKAINPAYSSGDLRYPLLHPNFDRDFAFHFAVGYPF